MGKHTYTFEADSFEELCKDIAGAHQRLNRQLTLAESEYEEKKIQEELLAKEAKEKAKEAKRKAAKVADAPALAPLAPVPPPKQVLTSVATPAVCEDSNPFGDDDVPAVPVDVDELKKAGGAYVAKHGLPEFKTFLATFECQMVKDLKPEHHAAFMKGCAA